MARTSFLRRALHSRLLLGLIVMILALLGMAFGRQILRNHEIEGEIAKLQSQEKELRARNLHLGDLQQALQTESFLEREARLKLDLKKPGEQLVIIQDKTSASEPFKTLEELMGTDAASDAQGSTASHGMNPRHWWCYFFDRSCFANLVSYATHS